MAQRSPAPVRPAVPAGTRRTGTATTRPGASDTRASVSSANKVSSATAPSKPVTSSKPVTQTQLQDDIKNLENQLAAMQRGEAQTNALLGRELTDAQGQIAAQQANAAQQSTTTGSSTGLGSLLSLQSPTTLLLGLAIAGGAWWYLRRRRQAAPSKAKGNAKVAP